MLIQYVGFRPAKRKVGPYRWEDENGYVQDVTDATVAAELLTHPPNDFDLAADEPLLACGLSKHEAAALALGGILTVVALGGLSGRKLANVASDAGLNIDDLQKWVSAAHSMGVEEAAPVNENGGGD